jgi:hypothetical protein
VRDESPQATLVDLRSVADADLRRAVVMVTQQSFLFSGSVGDNIALGSPSAPRSGWWRRPVRWAPTSSSPHYPTVMTPTCANAAGGYPPASGNWRPLPERSGCRLL